jgi:Tfp pilus assembly protein PilO
MAIAAAAIEEETRAQEAANAANLEALKEQQEHLRQEYARMRVFFQLEL